MLHNYVMETVAAVNNICQGKQGLSYQWNAIISYLCYEEYMILGSCFPTDFYGFSQYHNHFAN